MYSNENDENDNDEFRSFSSSTEFSPADFSRWNQVSIQGGHTNARQWDQVERMQNVET